MTGLLELAERAEAARAPDRELDAKIHAAIGNRLSHTKSGCVETYSGRKIPAYTASFEAATLLMPDGWYLGLQQNWHPQSLDDWSAWTHKHGTLARDAIEVCAATAALALTAAALRARATPSESSPT